MIKQSLRAFAASLVLAVPSLALAKAPASAHAPMKASASAPVKATTPAPSPSKDNAEKTPAAAKKKHSGKGDAAKTDKTDKTDNNAKH
jgi:hypothetical protein